MAQISSLNKQNQVSERFAFSDATGLPGGEYSTGVRTIDRLRGEEHTEPNIYDLKSSGAESLEVRGLYRENSRIGVKQAAPPEILEQFLGQVNRIEEQIAFVTLTSPEGEEIHGHCDLAVLRSANVDSGDWFECKTVRRGGEVTVEVSRRERIPLSKEMLDRMDSELSEGLKGLV